MDIKDIELILDKDEKKKAKKIEDDILKLKREIYDKYYYISMTKEVKEEAKKTFLSKIDNILKKDDMVLKKRKKIIEWSKKNINF